MNNRAVPPFHILVFSLAKKNIRKLGNQLKLIVVVAGFIVFLTMQVGRLNIFAQILLATSYALCLTSFISSTFMGSYLDGFSDGVDIVIKEVKTIMREIETKRFNKK